MDTRTTARTTSLALIVVLALSGWSAAAAKRPAKPRCNTPIGWRLAAQDGQAVVISKALRAPGPLYGAEHWRYCVRGTRPFHELVQTTGCCYDGGYLQRPTGNPNLVKIVTLSGPYIAYAAIWSGRGPPAASQIRILNLRTGQRATSPVQATLTDPVPLLLSPIGTAAWIWIVEENPTGPSPTQAEMVQALSAPSGHLVTLDTAPHPGTDLAVLALANLQLYHCLAPCASSVTVVGWTHNGSQRYAGMS
jgi:hypothetical protein